MIFAAHQPNYIPYLGYFHKMAHSDVLVHLDTVQFARGGFGNRNRVKVPNGTVYLTVPITHTGHKATYRDVRWPDNKWQDKHLTTVEQGYKRAPYFDDVFPIYAHAIRAHESFVEMTIGLIGSFAAYLGIATRQCRLSELLSQFGRKTQMLVDIGRALGADTYLSGTGGGKEYNDESLLERNGIRLTYSEFEHPTYSQLWGEFVPNLAALDLLMNCGPKSRAVLGLDRQERAGSCAS